MATFHYTARTLRGDQVTGHLQADSAAAAVRALDEKQLYDLAYNVIEPQIERIQGVASASVGVSGRIWSCPLRRPTSTSWHSSSA